MSSSSSAKSLPEIARLRLRPPASGELSALVYHSPLFATHFAKTVAGLAVPPAAEELLVDIFGHKLCFAVVGLEPPAEGKAMRVGPGTRIEFEGESASPPRVAAEEFYVDVAGQWAQLRDSLRHQLGGETLFPLEGMLLSGESGAGKSLLLRKAAAEFAQTAHVELLTGKSLLDHRHLLPRLTAQRPNLLLLDDMGWKEAESLAGLEQVFKLAGQFRLLVVASCAAAELKAWGETRLRGRFGKVIELQNPGHHERRLLLEHYLARIAASLQQRGQAASDERQLSEIADLLLLRTPALSCREIAGLLREVEQHHVLAPCALSPASVVRSLSGLKTARAAQPAVERVLFAQIGGYEAVKAKIRTVIELPLTRPALFVARGIKPSTGILLYGPPGCSKTMFAKAIATESSFSFFAVKGPEVFSKYVGDSEQRVREIFRQARLAAPSVVFFDEIDAIAARREKKTDVGDRVLTQLLTEMDGAETAKDLELGGQAAPGRYVLSQYMQNLVVVIAATNRPDTLDPAILRPGRFDELVYVPLPDLPARLSILRLSTAKMPVEAALDLEALAEATEGLSGAELVQLCKEAALKGIYELREDELVREKDFRTILAQFKSRLSSDELQKFALFAGNSRLIA